MIHVDWGWNGGVGLVSSCVSDVLELQDCRRVAAVEEVS